MHIEIYCSRYLYRYILNLSHSLNTVGASLFWTSASDPHPGSCAFLPPGSGINFFRIQDPDPWMNYLLTMMTCSCKHEEQEKKITGSFYVSYLFLCTGKIRDEKTLNEKMFGSGIKTPFWTRRYHLRRRETTRKRK
jgi:hypothetical protein